MNAQAKEIKNKVMCVINSFAIVYFFFGLKVHANTKNKRNVYIIPKRNNYSSN